MRFYIKNSGKDVNDKLMKQMGFFHHIRLDDPNFNIGNISYWINK